MKYAVTIRPATPADAHLKTYDYTKLTAVNTCPRWGVIRYDHHKVMVEHERSMATDAGRAMHLGYAAVRLYDYIHDHGLDAEHDPRAVAAGLFPADVIDELWAVPKRGGSKEAVLRNFAITALHGSGYYDDPDDPKRTLSNLEASLIAYCDRWPLIRKPLYVGPMGPGIELPIDVVVRFDLDPAGIAGMVERYVEFRLTGRMDGVHLMPDGSLEIHENKTASRITDSWRNTFDTSHQVTGYIVAMGLITGLPIKRARIIGNQIPLPRDYASGVVDVVVHRSASQIEQWFDWLLHSVQVYEQYRDHPLDAPMYTHSCGRFFRTCSFIPLCTAERDEQAEILASMPVQEWSPLYSETGGDA